MLSIVRPGFETASALAGECIPALTRPNATDAGLTFNVAAAIAGPQLPTVTTGSDGDEREFGDVESFFHHNGPQVVSI